MTQKRERLCCYVVFFLIVLFDGSVFTWVWMRGNIEMTMAVVLALSSTVLFSLYLLIIRNHEKAIQDDVQDKLRSSNYKLRESENKLREAHSMARLGYWCWDVKTGNVEWSDEVYKIFEKDPESFTPTIDSVMALSPWPEDRNRHNELIQQAIESHDPGQFEQKFLLPGDRVGYYYSTFQGVYDDLGELVVLKGTVQDITERKKLSEQLSHSRKMDAIGQLAGGVAHDFNNMLTGILGAAQMIQLRDNLDERDAEFLEMITKAALRSADLTAKLLAFGRKGKIMSTTINLHEIIDEAVAILQRTLDKKVEIEVIKKAERPTTTGDDTALQNALMNLCINAAHAMPEGGRIQLETRNIELEKDYCDASSFELTPGEYVELQVRDEGCGIALENQDKIFEPFFTTKERGSGTGLGLASVYATMKDHHGAVSVYSELERGTVFHIYLPCSEARSVEMKNKIRKITQGHGLVLLVDDEELIREVGKHMLENMGYQVVLARNGVEAIEIYRAREKEIDLVILDMIMPVMNGREAFAKLKEINQDCKVLISSGFAKDEDLNEMRQRGFAGFVHKPYSSNELSEAVSKAFCQ